MNENFSQSQSSNVYLAGRSKIIVFVRIFFLKSHEIAVILFISRNCTLAAESRRRI